MAFPPTRPSYHSVFAFPAVGDPLAQRLRLTAIGLQHETGRTRRTRRIDWDNQRRLQAGDPHRAVLQCTLSGRGWFRDQRGEHAVETGQAFLAIIPSATGYRLASDDAWQWVWATFAGDQALALVAGLIGRHGGILRLEHGSAPVRRLERMWTSCLQHGLPSQRLQAEWAWQLLLDLSATLAPTAGEPRLAAARLTIEERLDDPALSVAELARSCGLSRAHFSRAFSRLHGESPAACLRRRRLERAADLLVGTDLPAAAVATALGFASASHFTALFRRTHGCTPGRFRQRNGGGTRRG